jgi:hypothetical protein
MGRGSFGKWLGRAPRCKNGGVPDARQLEPDRSVALSNRRASEGREPSRIRDTDADPYSLRIESPADEQHLTALSLGKSAENLRRKRAEVIDAVASRHQDYHRKIEGGDFLLVGEIAIRCEEYVELARSQREQLAIPLAGPSHLGNGLGIVAGESAFQASGKALVKQDAHGRRAPPLPALTQRRPDPC